MSLPVAAMFPGMEYIPLILMSLGVGVLTGIVSVVTALTRQRAASRGCAGLCIVVSLISTIIFVFLIGRNLYPHAYAIMAAPSLLGWISLRLSRHQVASTSQFRFCDSCGRRNAYTTTICPRCMKRQEPITPRHSDPVPSNPYHPPAAE